ncbi:hypothetical protein [Candidatus Pyrohabitans sp.]
MKYKQKILTLVRWETILFIGGFLLLVGLIFEVKELEFHKYDFSFEAEPSTVMFSDFQIYYDFTKKNGKMSFEIGGTYKLERIEIGLPKELSIKKIIWINGTRKRNAYQFKENQDYRIEEIMGYNKKKYLIHSLDSNKKSDWTYMEISLNGTIYPNAEFMFTPAGNKILPPTGDENGAFFKFYLGTRDFVCDNIKCFESFRPDELVDHYYNNTLRISTVKMLEGWENVGHHIFTLNYNKKVRWFAELLRNIGLGIVFIAIGMLLESLKNKKKN